MNSSRKIIVGIPARMGSTRFPGKPLCKINGIPMIEHCYRRAELAKNVSEVFLAICDKELEKFALSKKFNYVMTDMNIQRPGLRVAEACKQKNLNDRDIVVVIQGDEPLTSPNMIDLSIKPFFEETQSDIEIVNLCKEIEMEEMKDPNEVKVVCDLNMNAMYMSRSFIPSIDHEEIRSKWYKQVCVMPFTWQTLRRLNFKLNPTSLEKQESIEMLRALQHGIKVKMIVSNELTKSVDCENDRIQVEKLMLNDIYYQKYKNIR